ncbi:unnamed protein product [Mucor hiemalis]
MLNKIVKISTILVALYAALIVLLSLEAPQRSIIFLHWLKIPLHPKFETPEYYGFGHNSARNFKIKTSDNVTLGAWHFLPTEYYKKHELRTQSYVKDQVFDNALSDNEYETIVYFHGNALHRAASWRIDLYKQLLNRFRKVNVIVIDYRGFGDSESTPSETGLRLDALATIDWLNRKNVSNKRISLIGHSLGKPIGVQVYFFLCSFPSPPIGTGVATTLAYQMALADNPVKGLILKAGYSSMGALMFEHKIIPYLPLLAPMKRIPFMEKWLLSSLKHNFDSLSRIEYVNCPLLIIHGTGDIEIPIENAYNMFKRATNNNGTFEQLERSGKISRTIIPNEAVIYKSSTPRVTLVELEFGDHNNVGYFDYTYQSLGDLLGITE